MSRGRQLKPTQVDVVINGKTGISTSIFLDRNCLDFFSKVGDLEIRAASATECKEKTREALTKFGGFAWQRVIEASVDGQENWHTNKRDGLTRHFKLAGSFCRFERALKFGLETSVRSKWLKRPFLEDLNEYDREAVDDTGNELLFASEWWDSTTNQRIDGNDVPMLVPYTPELWDALLAIENTIEKARLHIGTLFDNENGGKRLLDIGLNFKALLGGKP